MLHHFEEAANEDWPNPDKGRGLRGGRAPRGALHGGRRGGCGGRGSEVKAPGDAAGAEGEAQQEGKEDQQAPPPANLAEVMAV